MIFLVTAYAFNSALNVEEPIRVTTGRHFNYNGDSYHPDLDKVMVIKEELFKDTAVEGEASNAVGEVSLVNVDGRYDRLADYIFDGRRIVVHVVPEEESDESEVRLFFTGTMRYYNLTVEKFTIYVKSRLEELNTAMLSATFGGTNPGSGGTGGRDGSEDALKGEKKPAIYGRAFNVAPAVINEFYLIYACNYDLAGNPKAVENFWSVRGRGVEYIYEGDVATYALLKAATISAGYYKTCLAEGLVRLGTVPNGDVTCDIIEASGASSTVSGVVTRILEDFCGYAAETDFDTVSLNQLSDVNSCPVGVYVTDEETKLAVLTALLQSVGAWMSPDNYGVFRFGLIDAPTALSSAYFTKDNFEDSFEKIQVGDQGRNIPAYMLTLKHTKNWKVQDKNAFVHSVLLNRQELYGRPFTETVEQDLTIKASSPNSPALVYETLLQGPLSVFIRNPNGEFPFAAVSPFDWVKVDTGTGGTLVADTTNKQFTLTAGTNYVYATQTLARPGRILTGTYTLKFTANTYAGNTKVSILENAVETFSQIVTVSPEGFVNCEFTLTSVNDVTIRIGTDDELSFTEVSLTEVQAVGPSYESDRRFNIQKELVSMYTFKVDFDEGEAVLLGSTVNVAYERFNLVAGADFLVVGRETETNEGKITFDVWRP